MQWYEILIIIAAVGFVVWVAARGIVRRKNTPGLADVVRNVPNAACAAQKGISKNKNKNNGCFLRIISA